MSATRSLDDLTQRRRVSIEAPAAGAKGRVRRDPENARLSRLQKPTQIVQRRDNGTRNGEATLAWPALRSTPEGLLERALHGDHGAKARVIELVQRGLASERAEQKRRAS